ELYLAEATKAGRKASSTYKKAGKGGAIPNFEQKDIEQGKRNSSIARKQSKGPQSALEKALAKGKELKKKGLQVAQGVHDGLGKVHGYVGKGLEVAGKV